jgi:hypothetical protein
MRSPRRTLFLVALSVAALALAACGEEGDGAASEGPADTDADASTTTSEPAAGTGKGTFVVGDRTYAFDAKRCLAEEGDPLGTVEAEGDGTFDNRAFTVTIKSSPGPTSVIETIQVVFAATEAVVGTNFVQLPSGAADVKFEVAEDGEAAGTIAVMGTGGQPSGEGTLTLTCDPA